MPIQTIDLGTAPRDGTGDDLREAGRKINENVTDLDARTTAAAARAATSLQPGDLTGVIRSAPGSTGGGAISNVIRVTQAQYDAIPVPEADTLYVIEA